MRRAGLPSAWAPGHGKHACGSQLPVCVQRGSTTSRWRCELIDLLSSCAIVCCAFCCSLRRGRTTFSPWTGNFSAAPVWSDQVRWQGLARGRLAWQGWALSGPLAWQGWALSGSLAGQLQWQGCLRAGQVQWHSSASWLVGGFVGLGFVLAGPRGPGFMGLAGFGPVCSASAGSALLAVFGSAATGAAAADAVSALCLPGGGVGGGAAGGGPGREETSSSMSSKHCQAKRQGSSMELKL